MEKKGMTKRELKIMTRRLIRESARHMSIPKTANEFVEDYNDEIVDGSGWWCVIIPD